MTTHQSSTGNWFKIKRVLTDVGSLCEALKQVARQCEQNAGLISCMNVRDAAFKKNLDQIDPLFMYTQILKEILLSIEFDYNHIKLFIDYLL